MQQGQKVRSTVTRIAGGVMAGGSLLVLVGGVVTASEANAAPEPHKSYVCKYVDKPGENERLQTGNNPIWVDNNSLLGYDGTVTVGQSFKDGQIRSVVIVANTPKLDPEPTIADCAPPAPPTSVTTTTATLIPPTSTTSTTTKPHTTTTTRATTTPSTSKTTPAATVTPAKSPSLYPLKPVRAGVDSYGTSGEVAVTPGRAALVLLALAGLWAAFGGRLPRVTRVERGRHEA
jgi:hypothetical protein